MYSYDWQGFLSDAPIPNRQTAVPPPAVEDWPAGMRPNFTGHYWVYLPWPPPELPVSVPQVISMRQCRLVLLKAGLLPAVDAALAALPGEEGAAARVDWEYATQVERNNPLLLAMCAQLGFNDALIDDLFREAAAL